MEQIDEKFAQSASATTTDEVIVAVAEIRYTAIVRTTGLARALRRTRRSSRRCAARLLRRVPRCW
ncbi:hypothetical protein BC826DRAFT_1046243 [Russula brevipes]|nr:hypothetical protein BC826DRAFT_1046243 [Russula brevipes]